MEQALETEARPTLSLDPRLRLVFGQGKTLPEIQQLVQTFSSYFTASEYQPPVTEP
jgi:hypothetical protein